MNGLGSDEFIAVFMKSFRRAMEQHLKEKQEAFRAIIINNAIAESANFDEVTLFIRLVSDLTVDQIRILQLLRNQVFRESEGGAIDKSLPLLRGLDAHSIAGISLQTFLFDTLTPRRR